MVRSCLLICILLLFFYKYIGYSMSQFTVTEDWQPTCLRPHYSGCSYFARRKHLTLSHWASVKAACRDMHWLPVCERIEFKILVLTYSVLSSGRPCYLRELFTYHMPARSLRSSFHDKKLVVPLSKTKLPERSLLLLFHFYGIPYLMISELVYLFYPPNLP